MVECIEWKVVRENLHGSFMFLCVLGAKPFVLDWIFKDVCIETDLKNRNVISLQRKRQICLLSRIIKIMSPSRAYSGVPIDHYKRFEFPGSEFTCSTTHCICTYHLAFFCLFWENLVSVPPQSICWLPCWLLCWVMKFFELEKWVSFLWWAPIKLWQANLLAAK